jgi:hypothetical protein
MARNAASFNRSKSRFKSQPTILVICEDSKSGKRYLEDASLYFRVNILVEITHCGKTDPLNIVKEAISRQGKFDHVFCAIDRDTHATFDEALNLVKNSKKVEIIASYPCFEFWLLLHYGYNRKPYATAGIHSAADLLIKDLRSYPGLEKYAKGNNVGVFDSLQGSRFDEARKIAPKILAEAIASEEMNPSTTLHELLDFFEKLSKPQQL